MDRVALRLRLLPLTEAATAVALSVLLGNIRLLELPNGGSIAFGTLPLLALGISRGVRLGVLTGICAGIAHALAGGTIVHPVQLGLDYGAAYAALGVAGIVPGAAASRLRLSIGVLLAVCLHLSAVTLSGMVFFAPTGSSQAAFIYSLGYNASTVLPECAIALWLLPAVLHAMARANPADAWRRGVARPPRLTHRRPRHVHRAPRVTDTPMHVASAIAPAPAAQRPGIAYEPSTGHGAPPTPHRSRLVRSAPFATRTPLLRASVASQRSSAS